MADKVELNLLASYQKILVLTRIYTLCIIKTLC